MKTVKSILKLDTVDTLATEKSRKGLPGLYMPQTDNCSLGL